MVLMKIMTKTAKIIPPIPIEIREGNITSHQDQEM
jgi:hypothetical protein